MGEYCDISKVVIAKVGKDTPGVYNIVTKKHYAGVFKRIALRWQNAIIRRLGRNVGPTTGTPRSVSTLPLLATSDEERIVGENCYGKRNEITGICGITDAGKIPKVFISDSSYVIKANWRYEFEENIREETTASEGE